MRGLGKVSLCTGIALISYYGVSLPFGYIFAFLVGTHSTLSENSQQITHNGMGLFGIWLGMYLGQAVLVAGYQYSISIKLDWEKIVEEARARA